MTASAVTGTPAIQPGKAAPTPHRPLWSDRWCRFAFVAAGAWLLCYAVLTWAGQANEAFGMFVGDGLYLVPIVVSVPVAFAASRRVPGRHATMWRILTVALLAQLAGETLWAGYDYLTPDGAPSPSFADLFYLVASVLTVVAVVVGFGDAGLLRHLRGSLDTALIVLSIGGLGWHALITPQASVNTSPGDLVNLSYPLLDVVTLSSIVIVGMGGYRRLPAAMRLVTLAVGLNVVSDMGYTYLTIFSSYDPASWINVAFQAANTIFPVAAVVAMRRREPPAQRLLFDRGLALMPIALSMTATILLVAFDKNHSGQVTNATLAVGGMLFAMVLLRQYLFVKDRGTLAEDLHAAVQEQRRLAVTDGLTGLYNRRHLTATVDEADAESVGSNSTAFMVIDIDHFKSINDTYGHLAGDDVLRGVAARLSAASREHDLVARYGGEEFVILLPDTDEPTIRKVAERLRRAIGDEPFRTPSGRAITVTTSIGVALATGPDRLNNLMERADRALYQSKRAGRDRVTGPWTPPEAAERSEPALSAPAEHLHPG
ncbi:GGDEF domain-containing protein [Actinoplanes sp. NPDC051470]|uniref:GGDEF domain-containing protein n=1 Tax=unclassified Actinoplanes TaxID=2626549 RepID=UPI0034133803